MKIKFGVYAGVAVLPDGDWYRAGIVIGPRDKTGLPKLEAHLLGFRGNLYGKKVILHLIKFLRPYRLFSSEARLKQQIRKDLQLIKHLPFHE
jgi:riboflavin kinase / FMN adenylyltransferase